ncbi:hypothetical protein SEUCBS139899_001255 [Sporothrix eucalyptigena]|uniref:Uncharacterized protein n=1 Tax=Sporothrix eucalyptigena TaxID=1812306 RepID=A0ABP0C8B8_9PEZI
MNKTKGRKKDTGTNDQLKEIKPTKTNMRMMLGVAAQEGHRSLVLSTIGFCPEILASDFAWGRKPQEWASNPTIWWRGVLTEDEFRGKGLWRSDRWNDASYRKACEQNLERLSRV